VLFSLLHCECWPIFSPHQCERTFFFFGNVADFPSALFGLKVRPVKFLFPPLRGPGVFFFPSFFPFVRGIGFFFPGSEIEPHLFFLLSPSACTLEEIGNYPLPFSLRLSLPFPPFFFPSLSEDGGKIAPFFRLGILPVNCVLFFHLLPLST